jgi:oxygen-independent coproporphyrinogen III oxidase
VLAAVNREIPRMPIAEIVKVIRSLKANINFDFIYGLPLQTKQSFTKTIEQAIELNPDRLVTFSYAHVPHLKPLQKHIDTHTMLSGEEKLDLLHTSYGLLCNAGYTAIGLDHFANPTDSLALAAKSKTLHRNFQGYCSSEITGQVYAFGASGISQFSDSFFQNHRTPEAYKNAILTNQYATHAGYVLSNSEQIISHCIESIMCNGLLNITEMATQQGISQNELTILFSNKTKAIEDLIKDKLLLYSDNTYTVTEMGSYFLRNIAAAFDPAFTPTAQKFSSSI